MPDIDPAALSRTDSIPHQLPNPLPLSRSNGTSLQSTQRAQKAATTAQRIDYEPLYANLKAAIGDNWNVYKDALNYFLLGHYNQSELSSRLDSSIISDAHTQHLHNQFVAAILANAARDAPDLGVATWVSANDKPTLLSKPAAGDEAEQKLKREIMGLPARDRRRIKEVPDWPSIDIIDQQIFRQLTDYHLAKQIKLPDAVPASAGGQVKTNWDLEIRKRYVPPLSSETFEFPSPPELHARMVPICYEESLPNGCSFECAEFMSTALDFFMKAVVTSISTRISRSASFTSSAPSVAVAPNQTTNGSGLGAIPAMSAKRPSDAGKKPTRRPLGLEDMRTAIEIGGWGELGSMPSIVLGIKEQYAEGVLEGWAYPSPSPLPSPSGDEVERECIMNGGKRPMMIPAVSATANGVANGGDDDEEEEEGDWGWEGGGLVDRRLLGNVLDEVLGGI
ncbi:MAG: hypothetical protein Q9167_001267 [Letrouitia subvulpina]